MLRYRIRRLGETTSTNTVALAAGGPEGLVVVADHQTAGRGRLGRSWVAPPGTALLVSIVLQPPAGSAHLAVSAVACAAAEACAAVTGVSPGLKWPNDLVVGERKLGGILAETSGNMTCLVVGLGLNVHVPADRPESIVAADLDDLAGKRVKREAVLDALLEELQPRYADLAGVLEEYRSRCVTIGQQVRVEQPRGVVVGRAVGVASDGSLMVEERGGAEVRVGVGDVVHVRPA